MGDERDVRAFFLASSLCIMLLKPQKIEGLYLLMFFFSIRLEISPVHTLRIEDNTNKDKITLISGTNVSTNYLRFGH